MKSATPPEFVVLGGGGAAFALAARIALRGETSAIYELEPWRRGGPWERSEGSLSLHLSPSDQELTIPIVDAQAVSETPVIVFAVPAYAERAFADDIQPWLQPGQLLVFACGTFGACVEEARIRAWQTRNVDVLVLEAVVQGGTLRGAVLAMSDDKSDVRAAAAVGDTTRLIDRVGNVFPSLIAAASPLEALFGNLNWILHPAISVANLGRLGSSYRYYVDGVTEPVGELIGALDRERLAVSKAAALNIDSCCDTLTRWYGHQGDARDVASTVRSTPAYASFAAPPSLEHRFLLEDIPFGLARIEAEGKRRDVPTPASTAVIDIASTAAASDLRLQPDGGVPRKDDDDS